jgi:hypothetical protein
MINTAVPATACKSYSLTALMMVLAFNNLDRLAVGVVLQDIKADLALSHTQLGILTGIAFALFYSVMGIAIARWADRGNRVSASAGSSCVRCREQIHALPMAFSVTVLRSRRVPRQPRAPRFAAKIPRTNLDRPHRILR